MAVTTKNSRKGAWRMAMAATLVAGMLAGCSTVDGVLGAVGLQRVPSTGPAPVIKVDRVPPASSAAASWTGTYRGMLPCPDCEGLRISLSLFKDATYELQTEQIGSDKRFERRGSFTFNGDETRITLDANGQNRSFDILPPNRLRMLGKDAAPITGPDAEPGDHLYVSDTVPGTVMVGPPASGMKQYVGRAQQQSAFGIMYSLDLNIQPQQAV